MIATIVGVMAIPCWIAFVYFAFRTWQINPDGGFGFGAMFKIYGFALSVVSGVAACSLTLLWRVLLVAIAAMLIVPPLPADAGHRCHVRVQAVAVHHQAYVQPIVQNVFYKVGEQVQLEAIVAKAIRAELQGIREQQAAPAQPASGSLLNAKCSKCHEQYDGVQAISCDDYRRFDEMYLKTHNGFDGGAAVPGKMQTVLGALSEVDFLNIKAEMLSLQEKPADDAGVLK